MTQTKLGTQDMLCFALYSANNAINRLYRPLLAKLGLTYPQYLVLVSLWSEDGKTVGQLGRELGLESNTLTPLLKRMGEGGLITRKRSSQDERVVEVSLTDKGRAMQSEAGEVAACVYEAMGLAPAELMELRDRVFHLRDEVASRTP